MFDKVDIDGLRINVSSFDQALDEVESLTAEGGSHYVCFLEGFLLYSAYSKPEVREILNAADLCYPDGIAAARLASWASGSHVMRVPGPTFILKACEYGVAKGWRHYFFGGKEGVAEKLSENLQAKYPGLQVAGTCCPPFRDMTDEEITAFAEELRGKNVDLLWVAFGGPRQEIWMHKYLGRIPVPVMLGVGAAFDFHTGNQKWCPKWLRFLGLEWLWRMLTGGKRVFSRNFFALHHVATRMAKVYFRGRKQRE